MIRRRIVYATWLLMAVALYLFENQTVTRAMLLASVLLPLLSALLAWRNAKDCTCRITAPESCARGESICITAEQAHKLPLILVQTELSCHNRFTGETLTLDASGRITAAHTGMLEITAKQRITDLFGLYQHENGAVQVLCPVLPEIGTVDVPPLPEVGAQAEPMGSVRPYIPGDPVRRIHWKLSQKTDTLLLREAEGSLDGEIVLALDLCGLEKPEELDAALCRFASVSASMTAQGMPHRLLWRCESTMETMPHSPDELPYALLYELPSHDVPPETENIPADQLLWIGRETIM